METNGAGNGTIKIIKVLSYGASIVDGQPKLKLHAVIQKEVIIGFNEDQKVNIYDKIKQSQEPTAAMFLAATDSLIAQGNLKEAESTARIAIKMSEGDDAVLLPLVDILYKNQLRDLAKVAFSAIGEGHPKVPELEKKRRWLFGRGR